MLNVKLNGIRERKGWRDGADRYGVDESPSPQAKEWCLMRGRAVTFAIPFTRGQRLARLSALPIVTPVNKCRHFTAFTAFIIGI